MTEQNKSFETLPNLSNLAFTNCFKNVQNVIQIALKQFFSETIAKIAQWQGKALPPHPHSDNLFFHTQSSQPTTFKIVITGFLNKQML